MLVRPPHYTFHGSSRDADLLMGVAALLDLSDMEEEECISPSFAGDTSALNASSAQGILWRRCFISWVATL
jgi:hypothetical protein